MTEYFLQFTNWITRMATTHNVDPVIWGMLFLTGKICLILCLAWAFKNIRSKKSFLIPLFFACFGNSLQHIYVVVFGRDIPVWIYLLMVVLFSLGVYSNWRKIRGKQKAEKVTEAI